MNERNKLPEPTFESEVFAMGTAFYEILCLNDSFAREYPTYKPNVQQSEANYVSKIAIFQGLFSNI